MDFSLFYFSAQAPHGKNPYRLLWEGARFAEQAGFTAIWTPERHFSPFGAPFPSPALTSAALTMITNNIQIRAGSVVLPLHHPIRVAEEWAMLDHFSSGRIGICFASGWHAQDFVLAPANFEKRHEVMLASFHTIQQLWKGETLDFPDPQGVSAPLRIHPLPKRDQIPYWFAASGHPGTFQLAAKQKGGILTHLLNQDLPTLAGKIALYRQSLGESNIADRPLTLMLHTFIGHSLEAVRAIAYPPLKAYLREALQLERTRKPSQSDNDMDPHDIEAILEQAAERYYAQGLFGTPEYCVPFVERLSQIGVQEIACLIDFGVEDQQVLDNFPHLSTLRQLCAAL